MLMYRQYIGKASEIQWLRSLHQRSGGPHDEGPYGPPGQGPAAATDRLAALRRRQENFPKRIMHTNSASYYLDDEALDMNWY